MTDAVAYAVDTEIQRVIDVYLKARAELRVLGERHPRRMGGNDNLIGRIGEFMALRYFERQGRKPTKLHGGLHSSHPGYDLVEGGARIQVKVITHENTLGRTARMTPGWTELLLIELGPDYKRSRIGHLRARDHIAACKKDKRLSKSPYVRRSMLSPNGLIGMYGEVTHGDDPPQVEIATKSDYERAREEHRPKRTITLFVGESRPAGGTFFYHGNSRLAAHTQQAFESVFQTKYRNPAEFLTAFNAAGCFLVDLCSEPVNGLTNSARRRACKDGVPALARVLAELRPRVVIGVKMDLELHIRRAIAESGIEEPSLHILPFPAYQHGAKYVSRLAASLNLRLLPCK